MLQTDDAPAIPLWINGHAYLTMAPAFLDVCLPDSGKVLRRTPLCGAGEVQKAVEAAQAALDSWARLNATARAALLAAVGESLAGYANHFAKLISEETGKASDAADAEVAEAVSLLRSAAGNNAAGVMGVVGVVGDAVFPLLGSLQLAVPALQAGATVLLKPDPRVPSVIFAWAELTARCALPPGVLNIVHGAEAVVEAMRATHGVRLLH